MSQTAYRTHHATEVTEALVGQKVTLAGWSIVAAITAAWRSSICATTPAWCRSSSTTRRWRARCAPSSSSRSPARFVCARTATRTRICHWQDRSRRRDHRCARQVRCAAVPGVHRARKRVREQAARRRCATEVPLPRPSPSVHAAQPQVALRHGQGRPPRAGGDGLHRGRDPDLHQVHPGRCPRLRRARPSGAWLLVRAAAVPAALEAAAHGLRRRALLPARPLLP